MNKKYIHPETTEMNVQSNIPFLGISQSETDPTGYTEEYFIREDKGTGFWGNDVNERSIWD